MQGRRIAVHQTAKLAGVAHPLLEFTTELPHVFIAVRSDTNRRRSGVPRQAANKALRGPSGGILSTSLPLARLLALTLLALLALTLLALLALLTLLALLALTLLALLALPCWPC